MEWGWFMEYAVCITLCLLQQVHGNAADSPLAPMGVTTTPQRTAASFPTTTFWPMQSTSKNSNRASSTLSNGSTPTVTASSPSSTPRTTVTAKPVTVGPPSPAPSSASTSPTTLAPSPSTPKQETTTTATTTTTTTTKAITSAKTQTSVPSTPTTKKPTTPVTTKTPVHTQTPPSNAGITVSSLKPGSNITGKSNNPLISATSKSSPEPTTTPRSPWPGESHYMQRATKTPEFLVAVVIASVGMFFIMLGTAVCSYKLYKKRKEKLKRHGSQRRILVSSNSDYSEIGQSTAGRSDYGSVFHITSPGDDDFFFTY